MCDANLSGLDPSQEAIVEQLRRRSARVRSAERSELVGQLAGAVSHDLNNALGVIVTYSSLLMSSTPAGTEARADLDTIFTAARRAGELSRWLNLFSEDPDSGGGRNYSLSDCARGIEKVAHRFLADGGLESEFDLEETGPPVGMPHRHVEDALFGLLAETASCLQEGSVVLSVRTELEAGVSRARIRACGVVEAESPVGELSLLAPGPFDTGTQQSLLPLDQLAERFGGQVSRTELDRGFELELRLPLYHDESDEERQA